MPRIEPDPSALTEIPIKRFYLPFVVSDTCPKCGAKASADLMRDGEYLSYPSLKKPEAVYLSCETCGKEWTVHLRLSFSLALVPDGEADDAKGGE